MADPTTNVFTQTLAQWNDAVRAAQQVLERANTPWTSATSAAYHYFKHKDDVPPNNAEQQPAQEPANDFGKISYINVV